VPTGPRPDHRTGPDDGADPLATAVASIGDRWTPLVVAALLDGPRRYSDLSDALAGIAPNVLAARLRHLAAEGLVVATPYQRRPVRMAYELTAPGRELAEALAVLASWGARRSGRTPIGHHETCGTPLELRPWCPTCDRTVEPEEDDELRHA
jgi:DNA-binding HxlR family transcriptional regulator